MFHIFMFTEVFCAIFDCTEKAVIIIFIEMNFLIKYGFQRGSKKKKYKIHTIRKDIKNLKYAKTIIMYKISTEIYLNYKVKKMTFKNI